MKQIFIFDQEDMQRLGNYLRVINESLLAIEQNKTNNECINTNLSIIQERTEKALKLIKG